MHQFIVLILLLPSFHSTTTNQLSIDVDCSSIKGVIRSFGDINDGPLPIWYVKNGDNLTEQYKNIGIKFIRTHDFYGPTDISNIFPDWNAATDDEKSYIFSSSDIVIKSIVENGFKVFYHLGESASNDKAKRQPPKNFTKWAEICKHIVMPCASSITNKNFTYHFLNYIASHHVPIDFFSSFYIRKMLDSYGLYNCENINTEWNINILAPQRDKENEKNAAYTANCIIAFQLSPIDHAFRYRGTQDNNFLPRLLGVDLSLFTYDGKYKRPALIYLAFRYMERTPYLITANISDGISYIAGISKDKRELSILISNYENRDENYNLEVRGFNCNYTFFIT